MNNNQKKEIFNIIKENALIFKNKNYQLTSNDSNWIFDFRKIFLKSNFLTKLAKFFWDKYEKLYPFQIGGLETGSIPFISAILMEGENRKKNTNGFFVRKQRKETGLGKIIEGELNNDPIIIVDDLIHSGKSIYKVIQAIKSEGKYELIKKIFVFIDFGSTKKLEIFNNINIPIDSIFSLRDFNLDLFGNTKNNINETFPPIIFPLNKHLVKIKNANPFLHVPKSNPVIDSKNNIFLAGEGGKLISFNLDKAQINWEFNISPTKGHKNILSSPILYKNKLIFGTYEGILYCLNKNNGKIIRKNIYPDWIGSSPDIDKKNNSLFVGFEIGVKSGIKGSLAKIDINNGETIWEIPFKEYVHCSPKVIEKFDLIACGGNDGQFIIAKNNGKVLFRTQLNGEIKGGFTTNKTNRFLYFGAFNRNFYIFDFLKRKLISIPTKGEIYGKPLYYKKNVFIGNLDKYLYHFSEEGNLINKVRSLGKIFSTPTPINNQLITFGSTDGYIYFYNFKTKKIQFTIPHNEKITTNIIYLKKEKKLLVYDFMNNLYIYDLKSYL